MKTFSTREEAAIWLIQNPGREVESCYARYAWKEGSIMFKSMVDSFWIKSTSMDVTSYTEILLPEAEKTLEEKVSEALGVAFGPQTVKAYAKLIRLAVEEAKKEGGK